MEAPSFRCEIYDGRGNGARVSGGILPESMSGFNLIWGAKWPEIRAPVGMIGCRGME